MGKYEEALERAKAGKPLDEVFPELKEREEERIRAHVVLIVKDWWRKIAEVTDDGKWPTEDEMLAYLEKKKDANKAIEAVERIDKYIDLHTANAHDVTDSNPDKKYYSGVDDTLSNIAGILISAYSEEKQKEQKPLSTEETELNSIAFLEQLGYTCVPPGVKQKPAEWSEEDENYLIDVKSAVNDYFDEGYAEELCTWLKSLRPQQKQEWSKEDEIMLRDVLGWIPAKSKPEFNQRRVDWLKNLPNRFALSNWKPSEDQMCALKYASTYVPDDEGTLAELYEQLKRLL